VITQIQLKNFKSYRFGTLYIARLTVLIGANASGKSNVIEALRILARTEFCYRNPKDGSSQLIRLQDIPDYPELIAQGSVGHLMTRGLLERFVKQHPGEQRKKRQGSGLLLSVLEEKIE